jgi:hypothetical protein
MATLGWLWRAEQSRRGGEGPRSALAAENHARTLSGKAASLVETNGKTPREQATKVTLRRLLGRR